MTLLITIIVALGAFFIGRLYVKKAFGPLSEHTCVLLWALQWIVLVLLLIWIVRASLWDNTFYKMSVWACVPVSAFLAGIVHSGISSGWRWFSLLPTLLTAAIQIGFIKPWAT